MKHLKILLIVLCSIVIVQSNSAFSQITLDSNGFGFSPPNKEEKTKLLKLWATRYNIHEAQYDKSGTPLRDQNENFTGARLNICDWCDAAIEGTVITTDSIGKSMTLNYAGLSEYQQVNCSKCLKYKKYKNKKIRYSLFSKAIGKYGDGVEGYKLIPFRTIAVDKNKIKIGSVVFIPDAVGKEIKLPNESFSKHDGFFFAADIGGDIKGNHIDVFTGVYKKNPFKFIKSKSNKKFKAYIIQNESIRSYFEKIHK